MGSWQPKMPMVAEYDEHFSHIKSFPLKQENIFKIPPDVFKVGCKNSRSKIDQFNLFRPKGPTFGDSGGPVWIETKGKVVQVAMPSSELDHYYFMNRIKGHLDWLAKQKNKYDP